MRVSYLVEYEAEAVAIQGLRVVYNIAVAVVIHTLCAVAVCTVVDIPWCMERKMSVQ